MAKRFYGNEFASVKGVTRCSSSALIAIADIAIAALDAASKLASNSGGARTDGTNRARKGGSTIATGSGSTGDNVKRRLA
jgi:hypothetical protein